MEVKIIYRINDEGGIDITDSDFDYGSVIRFSHKVDPNKAIVQGSLMIECDSNYRKPVSPEYKTLLMRRVASFRETYGHHYYDNAGNEAINIAMYGEDRVLKSLGFKQLLIRDVPQGAVLNAETAEDYPLVTCGTWVEPKHQFMIDSTEPGQYRLLPMTMESSMEMLNLMVQPIGPLTFILEKLNLINEHRREAHRKKS